MRRSCIAILFSRDVEQPILANAACFPILGNLYFSEAAYCWHAPSLPVGGVFSELRRTRSPMSAKSWSERRSTYSMRRSCIAILFSRDVEQPILANAACFPILGNLYF